MCGNNIKLNSEKINQTLMCKVPDVKPPADSCTIDQKDCPYIKLEPPKEDAVSFSLKYKTMKTDSIQTIHFMGDKEKEKETGLKSVIHDITTFGPVKIDKISVPTPGLVPVEMKDKVSSPASTPPGTSGLQSDKEKTIAIQIKVEF